MTRPDLGYTSGSTVKFDGFYSGDAGCGLVRVHEGRRLGLEGFERTYGRGWLYLTCETRNLAS
jgi:hypothetical protein